MYQDLRCCESVIKIYKVVPRSSNFIYKYLCADVKQSKCKFCRNGTQKRKFGGILTSFATRLLYYDILITK